ncbi:hypothetical protein WR25_01617 [Diploscapter pachys]|uniref:1-acylglycerol-3-phosphate O-acyltransferase n=1 Tax=Diploscapter pachys TaxID=2018661 RepID=A0A2A2LX00_9BILA|nr:hypothetical protein WR25_01617 [Diploscapter pachys]
MAANFGNTGNNIVMKEQKEWKRVEEREEKVHFRLKFCNSIFVERFKKADPMRAVDTCVDKMTKKNLKLWVFPEGTRNRHGGMLPFKKGAFNIAIKAQAPIIPMVTSDYRPFYSKPRKYFHFGGEIITQIMDPIETKGLTLDDAPKLAEEVREKMLKVYETISEEARRKMEAKGIKTAFKHQ